MQKDIHKKKRTYKAAMLLKYWKATIKEPLRDLCMIIAMYTQGIEAGLLYAVGWRTGLTKNSDGWFESIDTLSHIILQNKGGKEILVKGAMNGGSTFHAFLLKNGTVRVIKDDGLVFDIALKSEITTMNSGNFCDSLFIIDEKMRAYEIKDKRAVQVTGLPYGTKIKDVSCGNEFTVFLSECGRVFGTGSSWNGILGLPHRIENTEIPTEITFPNQSDSDRNRIMITMIHVNVNINGWVAVDSRQRAWIIGKNLMQFVRRDYESLDPCISIVEVWHFNNIQITQIECGEGHVIALDTKGRVYWFGRFNPKMPLPHVSLDPIPFSHQITLIRSGCNVVACKDETNKWYIWGWNLFNQITGLCGCKVICKKPIEGDVISNPMRCEWRGMFDATHVIDLQLGLHKAHAIVDSV